MEPPTTLIKEGSITLSSLFRFFLLHYMWNPQLTTLIKEGFLTHTFSFHIFLKQYKWNPQPSRKRFYWNNRANGAVVIHINDFLIVVKKVSIGFRPPQSLTKVLEVRSPIPAGKEVWVAIKNESKEAAKHIHMCVPRA